MRPRHPHAAESGVGEHTARESEAPNSVPMGKSAWRTPTPKFGPGTARFRGLIVFRDRRSSESGTLPTSTPWNAGARSSVPEFQIKIPNLELWKTAQQSPSPTSTLLGMPAQFGTHSLSQPTTTEMSVARSSVPPELYKTATCALARFQPLRLPGLVPAFLSSRLKF